MPFFGRTRVEVMPEQFSITITPGKSIVRGQFFVTCRKSAYILQLIDIIILKLKGHIVKRCISAIIEGSLVTIKLQDIHYGKLVWHFIFKA